MVAAGREFFPRLDVGSPAGRDPKSTRFSAGGRSDGYLAGWYLALTAGAFFRAATH